MAAGPRGVNDEFQVLLAELVDDLGAYLAGTAGGRGRVPGRCRGVRAGPRRGRAPLVRSRAIRPGTRPPAAGGPRLRRARAGATSRGPVDACLEPGLAGADVLVAPAYGPRGRATWPSAATRGRSSCVDHACGHRRLAIMSVPVGLVDGLPGGAWRSSPGPGRSGSSWPPPAVWNPSWRPRARCPAPTSRRRPRG